MTRGVETEGNKLRRLRHKKGVSMREVAEYAGVEIRTVSRWERDESPVQEELFQRRLARFYDRKKNRLFTPRGKVRSR